MSQNIPLRNIDTNPDNSRLMDKIHTRSFKGYFRRLRILGGALLFTLYFGTVWLTWGDRQAVFWDLSEKQFHIFGSTFWPQDLALLSAILIICAFGLFFLTVLAGRVWCGYAVVLLAMFASFSWAIVSRPMLTLDIEKDRSLFRYSAQGHIENSYVLKILNKSQQSRSYNIGVSGMDGLQLSSAASVSVGAGERVELPVSVSVAPESVETEVSTINFHLQSVEDPALKLAANSKFMGAIR